MPAMTLAGLPGACTVDVHLSLSSERPCLLPASPHLIWTPPNVPDSLTQEGGAWALISLNRAIKRVLLLMSTDQQWGSLTFFFSVAAGSGGV